LTRTQETAHARRSSDVLLAPWAKNPGIPTEVLDQLMAGCQKPEDLTAPEGPLALLKEALTERALQAEMTHHLGDGPGDQPPAQQDNRRNGQSLKTMRTDDGPVERCTQEAVEHLCTECRLPD
jgi:Transposase, Mutator family